MANGINSVTISVEQEVLDDLAQRLATVRWPDGETVEDWSQGVPLWHMQALCDYWRNRYDWRRCEAMLNSFGLFETEIHGLKIRFIHTRSSHQDALPILITHGWPGSIIEFHKVIDPLTAPVANGGKVEDAFHIVAPCLPGYGFSGKPTVNGWGAPKIALAWIELMRRLGYTRFIAQGGDWGAAVALEIALAGACEVAGVHLNMVFGSPAPEDMDNLTDHERVMLASSERFAMWGSGYSLQQATRPQTLGYGLADSPVGQAAWIYEKFFEWTDCNGDPRSILSFDEMIDNIMLYWLTRTGASSARLYWESFRNFRTDPVEIPVACSIFPKDIYSSSRRWAERRYKNLIHWNELEKGGHFAALEQPQLFVNELRTALSSLR